MRKALVVVAAAGTLLALVVPARGMPLELQSRGSVDFDPVTVGDVVLQGEPVQTSSVTRGAGALCKFNQEVEESFQLPDDIGPIAFEIVLTVEEGCNLVVKSFGEIKNPPTKDPAGRAIVDHRGWNFNTVFEYANITVAEERVKLTYTRNGGSVYNGRDRYHLSYTDYVPGWGTNLQAYNWYLTGPGQVWIYSRASTTARIPLSRPLRFHQGSPPIRAWSPQPAQSVRARSPWAGIRSAPEASTTSRDFGHGLREHLSASVWQLREPDRAPEQRSR